MLIYDIRPPKEATTGDYILDVFLHAFDKEPDQIIDLKSIMAIKTNNNDDDEEE